MQENALTINPGRLIMNFISSISAGSILRGLAVSSAAVFGAIASTAQAQQVMATFTLSSAIVDMESSGLTISPTGFATAESSGGVVTSISLPLGNFSVGPGGQLLTAQGESIEDTGFTFSLNGQSLHVPGFDLFVLGGGAQVALAALAPFPVSNGNIELDASTAQTTTPFFLGSDNQPHGSFVTGDLFLSDASAWDIALGVQLASGADPTDTAALAARLKATSLGTLAIESPVPEPQSSTFLGLGLACTLIRLRCSRRAS
jgi:hypothetical protein